jgi:hypothetical protein
MVAERPVWIRGENGKFKVFCKKSGEMRSTWLQQNKQCLFQIEY